VACTKGQTIFAKSLGKTDFGQLNNEPQINLTNLPLRCLFLPRFAVLIWNTDDTDETDFHGFPAWR
jgi:hypothetical protein